MSAIPEAIRIRIESLFERTAKKAQQKQTENMERQRQRLLLDKAKTPRSLPVQAAVFSNSKMILKAGITTYA